MSDLNNLQGELRKLKPPTFDGVNKRGDDVETWLLGIQKYFHLHSYSSKLEARISIYRLHGKTSMWWDPLKQVKHIDEKMISWKKFKKDFQQQHLSEHCYDKKMQEFIELKLGSMTLKEYENNFLELLRYVGFYQRGGGENTKVSKWTAIFLQRQNSV